MQEYVTRWLRQFDLSPAAWNFVLVGISLLVGAVLYSAFRLLGRFRDQSAKRGYLLFSVIRHLARPLAFWFPLFIFDLLLPLVRIPQVFRDRLAHLVEVALIITFAWCLIRLIYAIQNYVNHRLDIHTPDNLRQRRLLTQLMYVRRVIVMIVILLTIGAVLLTFATLRKLGAGLLTGVGVGGIIIGFAAQRSLANLLAGFQIAFTQPIRIDDEVVVEKEFGIVEEITLTYVVIRIWDERRLVLPINYFIEKPFENWTRTTSQMHGTVFFYLDYTIPVEWLRQQFRELVEQHPLWDKRTASLVVTDIRADVVEVRGLVSASSSGNVYEIRCYLREQLLRRIRESYPDCLPQQRVQVPSGSGREVTP